MFELTVPWWELVLRSAIVYGFLLLLLRITGKRQIGQLSPFDLVLLLILSNAVQNSMNAGDNSLLGGLIAAVTLVGLNYLVGYVTFKSKKLEKAIEGHPQILVHEGKIIEAVMTDARLTHTELASILRQHGYFATKDVKLAILEDNGAISVQGYETENPIKSKPVKSRPKKIL